MKNNTFFIVIREIDDSLCRSRNPDSHNWNKLLELNKNIINYTDRTLYAGWEFADNIEYTDYQDAKSMMAEYRLAMPNHTVSIHAKNH